MHHAIQQTINEIDALFTSVSIDFDDDAWRTGIPSTSGWYLIETDAPIEILKSVGVPHHKAHINIPATIESAAGLIKSGLAITQDGHNYYVIYNGEARDLKTRAKEHVRGHSKTFCIGLIDYSFLREYDWRFVYVAADKLKSLRNVDKVTRLLFEQAWRAKHGWPVLCKK